MCDTNAPGSIEKLFCSINTKKGRLSWLWRVFFAIKT